MRSILAGLLLALASLSTPAQQPAPAFPAPNLTEKGVRGMAASCAACHGTNGRAAPGSSVAGLAGRSKEDLVQVMAQFRGGQRPATVMHQIAKGYTEAEVAAMADYFSKLAR
jgi:sulfide dehydrogenase cytochrome subunit